MTEVLRAGHNHHGSRVETPIDARLPEPRDWKKASYDLLFYTVVGLEHLMVDLENAGRKGEYPWTYVNTLFKKWSKELEKRNKENKKRGIEPDLPVNDGPPIVPADVKELRKKVWREGGWGTRKDEKPERKLPAPGGEGGFNYSLLRKPAQPRKEPPPPKKEEEEEEDLFSDLGPLKGGHDLPFIPMP